ncbi:MAG: transglutaminase-like domain-containing protein [Oscillospiraceae bacterium]|nr:transglutaminase-like domain-containing protein [Oscillospiraceae bacterium]
MEDAAGKILRILKKHGEIFLLWLLCIVSVSASLYIYTENVIDVYTLVGAAAAAVLIKFYDFLRSKKLGGLIYFGTLIILGIAVPSVFIGGSWEDRFAFVRWFFSGAQAEETRVGFMLTLMPMMTFFLVSAYYYFTRIIYRSSMLALVSLIPFALAVKAAAVLPFAYAASISSANLIFFIIDGRKRLLKGSSEKSQTGSAATVYTDFAIAAVLLALIAPKPSETPYYEKFEAAVSMFSFGGTGENEYQGEYKQASGRIDELLRGESVLLYIISSPETAYMKTQVFNDYDSETGLWTNPDDTVYGSKSWQEDAQLLSFEKLSSAVKLADEMIREEAEEYGYLDEEDMLFSEYPWAERLTELADYQSYSIVYAQNFPAVYVPAPLRTTEVSIADSRVSWIARSDAGEIFTNLPLLAPNANYTVRYYSEKGMSGIIDSGLCDISTEEWDDFLWDAMWYIDGDSEEYSVLSKLRKESALAEQYREDYATEVSAEIQALADELTEGLEYDRQKAKAIENYFTGGGFRYDLNFEPPEGMDTPEYFLFESKTGICSDYARAYVLLARAAGLTVRYAEGFVPQMSGETEGTYFIYSDNAHAYPEVYIPVVGWTRFEPTPAGYIGSGGNGGSEDEDSDYTALILTAAVFVAGFGIFIVLVLFFPKIAEGVFRLRAKRAGSGKGVIMLYNRHLKNAENLFGESFRAFTPEQMERLANETTGESLDPLTDPFTAVCYGGGDIDRDAFEKAFECYKAQAKAMKKARKNRKRQSTEKN